MRADAARRVTPELLAAVAATLDTPLSRCVMLASQANLTEVCVTWILISLVYVGDEGCWGCWWLKLP
jgi:hypothetical protein